MSDKPTIHIVELFPGHLMLNGDMGNVAVLDRRARLAGAETVVTRVEPGESIPAEADIVTIGTGPASAQRAIADALPALGAPLAAAIERGAALLAVNAGFHLLGRTVRHRDGSELRGAGVFPITTEPGDGQTVTDEFTVDIAEGRLIGVENHAARVHLHEGSPLGTVVRGVGNDGTHEGYRDGVVIGTHMHGPVLAMNPVLADVILADAFTRHGASYTRTADHERIDAVARGARQHLARLAKVSVDRA